MDYGCVAPIICAMRSCSLLIANMAKKAGVRIEIAGALPGAAGAEFVSRCFTAIENAVKRRKLLPGQDPCRSRRRELSRKVARA